MSTTPAVFLWVPIGSDIERACLFAQHTLVQHCDPPGCALTLHTGQDTFDAIDAYGQDTADPSGLALLDQIRAHLNEWGGWFIAVVGHNHPVGP